MPQRKQCSTRNALRIKEHSADFLLQEVRFMRISDKAQAEYRPGLVHVPFKWSATKCARAGAGLASAMFRGVLCGDIPPWTTASRVTLLSDDCRYTIKTTRRKNENWRVDHAERTIYVTTAKGKAAAGAFAMEAVESACRDAIRNAASWLRSAPVAESLPPAEAEAVEEGFRDAMRRIFGEEADA